MVVPLTMARMYHHGDHPVCVPPICFKRQNPYKEVSFVAKSLVLSHFWDKFSYKKPLAEQDAKHGAFLVFAQLFMRHDGTSRFRRGLTSAYLCRPPFFVPTGDYFSFFCV
jgi:hypothetical protein